MANNCSNTKSHALCKQLLLTLACTPTQKAARVLVFYLGFVMPLFGRVKLSVRRNDGGKKTTSSWVRLY